MRIHVSSLNQYSFCPRSVYLSDVLKLETEPSANRSKGLVGHAVRKEMSLRQYGLLERVQNSEDINKCLVEEMEKILQDVPFIYRDMLDGVEIDECIPEIRNELLNEIKIMGEKLSDMLDSIGIDQTLKIITPWKVEYPLRSSRLKLSGRIDKVMKDKSYAPIEIKTGETGDGIWEGDRLQICAYALLLEEKFNIKSGIPFGFVEYTRIQEKRPVMNTEQLRRRVINTRDDILEILNGRIPDICPHGNGKKCKTCGFKEQCYKI